MVLIACGLPTIERGLAEGQPPRVATIGYLSLGGPSGFAR